MRNKYFKLNWQQPTAENTCRHHLHVVVVVQELEGLNAVDQVRGDGRPALDLQERVAAEPVLLTIANGGI